MENGSEHELLVNAIHVQGDPRVVECQYASFVLFREPLSVQPVSQARKNQKVSSACCLLYIVSIF